jgi:ABC-2 type transport system ATP-binding protein
VLRLDSLAKRFGNVQAVSGLSLSVRRGEVLGLLGPNGAGKSTTLSMAIGLIAPDAGTVEYEGLGSPRSASVRARIGYAPQSLALYDELTGAENLRFFARLQGIRRIRERVDAALERVQLSARAGDRVRTYSGGMQRRLNLAVALLNDPEFLLLDEPTAGVDPQSRNNILELVRSLADEGRTVVYTTHYMEEAARLCHRIAVMDHGRILDVGPLGDLLARHGGATSLVVERGEATERKLVADPVRELGELLAAGGVTGVRVEPPDLETVFLSLTGRSLRD